ncbi:MAG TPA: hypothetical protein VHE83_05425 [Mycobacteriales bacterium]|nr:hypothetical protein [Mycobacteriales bacterium]
MAELPVLDDLLLTVYRARLRFPDLDDAALAERLALSPAALARADLALTVAQLLLPATEGSAARAIRPDVAIVRLIAVEESQRAQSSARISQLRDSLPAMMTAFQAGVDRSAEHIEIEIVEGLPKVYERLTEVAATCRSTWRSSQNLRGGELVKRDPTFHEKDIAIQRSLTAAGVRRRCLVPASEARHPYIFDTMLSYAAGGEEHRVTEDPVPHMVLSDETVALIPIDVDQTARGALVIRTSSVVRCLVELYERAWQAASPLDAWLHRPRDRRSQLLHLLSRGAKDEAMARALGVGLRTVRREISDLMNELGAESRFQAGVLAAERGWLTSV